ncbi:MAG: MMPL family transporter [Fidelibacterota bacterium]
MRDKLLVKLAHWAVFRTVRVLGIVMVLTVVFGGLASRIQISPKWSDMLPAGDKRTLEFDRILDEFVSASSIVIVVQGEEDRIKAFADALAPRLLKALPIPPGGSPHGTGKESENRVFIRRVDYKQEVDFLRQHGLMIMPQEDLENVNTIFDDPNLIPFLTHLNDSFEKEYIQGKEALSTREKEDRAYGFLQGIENWLRLMESYLSGSQVSSSAMETTVQEFLLGEPYFISYDREALIMNAIPNFSMMDTDLMIQGTEAVQAVVDETLKEFPHVRAGLTGAIPLGHDEMVYGMEGLQVTSTLALVAIVILLIMAFRMWMAPLLAGLNLVVGLIWAAGVASLFVPVLNIMTAMFVVVLLGLGIDFSIHIIASFSEMRALGLPVDQAMREGLLKSGKGVMTGAVTTACAFFALLIGDSRAMSEMGLVTGLGLLGVGASTFALLPALLVVRERVKERLGGKDRAGEPEVRDISFAFLGRTARTLQNRFILASVGAGVVSAFLIWSASRITFDYNYMNIEPKGIPSVTLQDTVLDKFDLSMDFAYLIAESVDESRRLSKAAKRYGSVALVEDISLYLPSSEEQLRKRPLIEDIRRRMSRSSVLPLRGHQDLPYLKTELDRLKMNIMELQDLAFLGGQDKVFRQCADLVGDSDSVPESTVFGRLDVYLSGAKDPLMGLERFQNDFGDAFRTQVIDLANPETVELDSLPPSIMGRYANRERDLFLVTVLPGDNIWQDARFLKRFTEDLSGISPRATGFPPVFRALVEIIGRDGRNAAILTLFVVFALLWIDYRHPGHALMAMTPLAAGLVWMVGIMSLAGKQLDVVNIMGIPLILGIGVDDGVHIVHRWRREGKGSARIVFASTGKAIFLTSLTTMMAFGSLIFSVWRGYGSLGLALFIGVGACFLTTVVILPALIGWLEKKG